MPETETDNHPLTQDSVAVKQDTGAAETSAAPPDPIVADEDGDSHGPLYWFWHHSSKGISAFARRHTWWFIILSLLLFADLFITRGYIHEFVIGARRHLGAVIGFTTSAALMYWLFKRLPIRGKLLVMVVTVVISVTVYFWGDPVHNYASLYYRYCTLDLVDLEDLPETDHERIQPLNSVFSLAHEKMADSETPMFPHFVRLGEEYSFSIGIEPVYLIPRMFHGVKEVYAVKATTATPDFSQENRKKVSFEVGESLLFGRNTYVSTCRAFGLWRYLNYEPDGVLYTTDDNGEWVQVVPLIRWRGILFPWPEFGGVQLIRQSPDTVIDSILRIFIGCGEWIRPDQIANYKFLKNQNLLSYNVSRYIANSFRFHNGFLAPFPGYHKGDIRIPDMPEDVNDQPFTTYFRMSEFGGENGLYHYFSLEPYNTEQQGLNTSLLIPADGSPKCYVYRHYARGSSLIGVTTVAAKVINERKQYDWDRNRPVEQRPYIKTIKGQKRFFWLTTVVTFKDKGGQKFIAGNKPDVILTDASTQATWWMDSLKSSTWLEQIAKEY